jgi:hypothetical protein
MRRVAKGHPLVEGEANKSTDTDAQVFLREHAGASPEEAGAHEVFSEMRLFPGLLNAAEPSVAADAPQAARMPTRSAEPPCI